MWWYQEFYRKYIGGMYVMQPSHVVVIVIDTSELSIHQGEKIKECNLKVFIYYNILSN